MISEFKKFISKGNALDLSIGIIIGGAFSNIVNSLVNDIFMPLIGLICGGIDFTNLKITIGNASIAYGSFIQATVNFLIIAYALFLLVKSLNKLNELRSKNKNKENEKEVVAPKDPNVLLLEEIRDLLKEKKK